MSYTTESTQSQCSQPTTFELSTTIHHRDVTQISFLTTSIWEAAEPERTFTETGAGIQPDINLAV
ncbi:hypothetical protein SS50377_20280 [Spironucleus salmonicida]|uniref:Uncharacterized protein n=1 Tax=Spironucleus salmonicida TaxID=348837 RepID=A0A9P8S166_9EUKA|nr:hypothetical protein SS50377_20280 [Spironucleus salmonicida]